MSVIWRQGSLYQSVAYDSEQDLESTISEIASTLFGPDRIYINVKRKVGRNIPDGYLVDLSGPQATLSVVEVELASHDLFRHMAVQLLQFSFSIVDDIWTLKSVLHDALRASPSDWSRCEDFVKSHQLNSIDHLLEGLIRQPFAALVIVDSVSDQLETLFSDRFRFPVEVLEVSRFENDRHERLYRFEPLLADVANDSYGGGEQNVRAPRAIPIRDIDTIVVPARPDGFAKTFIGKNEWHSIKIHGAMIPQIKFIAAYQVDPIRAITHIAPVREITSVGAAPGKYRLIFSEPASTIGPIEYLPGGRILPLRNSRYTTRERLMQAKTLDDVWANPAEPSADIADASAS